MVILNPSGSRETIVEEARDNLLDRAVGGDQAALVAVLKEHAPAARRAIAGRIPARWRSAISEDDVMQQTYADAVVHIHEFRSQHNGAFVNWLKVTAQRNLHDALKMLETVKRGGDRKRVDASSSDDSVPDLLGGLARTWTTPSRHAARNEAQSALERAIEQLPEDYAQVVTLYDLENRPIEEVARALNRSTGATYMLRARAHDRLHEIMGRTSKFFSR